MMQRQDQVHCVNLASLLITILNFTNSVDIKISFGRGDNMSVRVAQSSSFSSGTQYRY